MMLLTQEIKRRLPPLYSSDGSGFDAKPIHVKFFDPMGHGFWLIAEGSEQEDGDWLLYGYCELLPGCGEWGNVLLSELQSADVGFWLGVERDTAIDRPYLFRDFEGRYLKPRTERVG